MDREQQIYPSLRALRRAVVVSDMRHLTHAAKALGRSQSALTRSIVSLEKSLGIELFERTVTGVIETREGAILLRRVRAAIEHMALAEAELLRRAGNAGAPHTQSFLHFEVSNGKIFLFLATCDYKDIRRAAQSQDLALSTARKSIHELEQQIGQHLFEKEPHGTVRPSQFAETLAKYTKRALWEVRAGLDELESLHGDVAGTVHIGVMSTARSFLVPRAVDQLRRRHKRVLVAVYWANYADLKSALMCGDIDLIVGTLRPEEVVSGDHHTDTLIKDQIEIVAGAQHPLSHENDVCLRDLLAMDWILPPPHFPLRMWFRDLLEREGLREPKPFIETASLAIVRGVLLESDCVALSTRLQCWHDTVEHGLLRVVPVGEIVEAQTHAPFQLHITRRAGAVLSPAAEALYGFVADVASDVGEKVLSVSNGALA